MSMSRKDYRLLANAFGEAYADAECKEIEEGIDRALDFVIEALAADNPLFRADLFRKAARLPGREEAA